MKRTFLQTLAMCKKQGKSAKEAFIAYKLGIPVSCGGGEPVIPTDYEQVEYIEANGKQYIDTGFLIEGDSKCEIVQAFTNIKADVTQSFGCQFSNNQNRFNVTVYNNELYLILFKTGITITPLDKEKHTYKLDSVESFVQYDNEKISVPKVFDDTLQKSTFCLFVRNEKGLYRLYCYAKLYSAKFYKGNTLMRDFIPVKRKADNVAGLWDKVEKKFYTSKTSTPLIAP